jgi:hypothetical protein
MKRTLILAVLAVLLIFQMGCVKATISGGPQIRVPGGVLRGGLFPPQLLLGITNTTPLLIRVKALSAVDRVQATLTQGEELDIPFRHFSGDCRDINVTLSAYEPESGKYITSTTRHFSVCGGQNRTDYWNVRWSGDQRSYTIQ